MINYFTNQLLRWGKNDIVRKHANYYIQYRQCSITYQWHFGSQTGNQFFIRKVDSQVNKQMLLLENSLMQREIAAVPIKPLINHQ